MLKVSPFSTFLRSLDDKLVKNLCFCNSSKSFHFHTRSQNAECNRLRTQTETCSLRSTPARCGLTHLAWRELVQYCVLQISVHTSAGTDRRTLRLRAFCVTRPLWLEMSRFSMFFLGFSNFSNFILPTRSSFQSPTSYHFIFSFIHFMSSFTSFMVRKNNQFGTPPIYNHAGWFWEQKKSAHYVLLHWTLSLSKHHLGQKGSGMTCQHSSAQGPV